MAVVSIGPLNPVSGSVAAGEAKVTAGTGWGRCEMDYCQGS